MDVINPYIHGGESVPFDGFGNASRSFDGTDDHILISPDTAIDNVFSEGATFAAWIKVDSVGVQPRIVDKRTNASGSSGWILFLDDVSGGSCGLYFRQDFSSNNYTVKTTAREITVGSWTHVAITYDSSSTTNDATMYVNGSSVGVTETGTPSGSSRSDSSKNLCLGDIDPAYTVVRRAFDGNFADVRIYDTDLSASDISDLYAGTDITTNLVGHWLKDTPSLLDHAGSNDATNYGSKFSYDNPSPAVEFGSMSRSFNGTSDYIDLGDSDDFSFGDGSNDSPFSASAWVKIVDATRFRILGKWDSTTANQNEEWTFTTNGSRQLALFLYDRSSDGLIGGTYSIDMSAYQNQWIHVVATYNGVGGANAGDGITLYLNGSAVNDNTQNVSNYTAMENTVNPLEIGSIRITSGRDYSDGKIADARIYDAELTSTDVSDIYNGTNVTTNLIGHWLTNNDDVKDYAGTNDGTNNGSTYSYDNPNALVEYGGASRSFNGTSDHIDIGDVLDSVFAGTGKKFTLSAWIKTTTLEDTDFLGKYNLAGQRSFLCRVLSDGNLAMVMSGNGNFTANRWGRQTDTAPISADTWHHVAITYDHTATGDYLRMWVDGVEDTTLTDWNTNGTFTSIFDGTAQLRISGIEGNLDTNWGGNIADVRIYDTDLSATEVYELYKGVDHRTNLIGQWLTNRDDVEDKVGTNDGSNNGSTYSTDSPL